MRLETGRSYFETLKRKSQSSFWYIQQNNRPVCLKNVSVLKDRETREERLVARGLELSLVVRDTTGTLADPECGLHLQGAVPSPSRSRRARGGAQAGVLALGDTRRATRRERGVLLTTHARRRQYEKEKRKTNVTTCQPLGDRGEGITGI